MYIYQKSANHIIAYLALKFPSKKCLKAQKKNYTSRLREDLEFHSVFTTSTVFSITNPRRCIRECSESHLLSSHCQHLETQTRLSQQQVSGSHLTTSSSLIDASDIPNVTPLSIKASDTGYLLWRGYCCHSGMKDLTLAVRS